MSAVTPAYVPPPDVTHYDGHRLPLRISMNGDRKYFGKRESVVHWFDLLDADHKNVRPDITDFDAAIAYVERANATMVRYGGRMGPAYQRHTALLYPRIIGLHPIEGYHVRTAAAFECLMLAPWGAPTDWITPEIRFQVWGTGCTALDDTSVREIRQDWIERWWVWRAAEDAEEARRNRLRRLS